MTPWRPALFAKLEQLGFGGKILSLIESMYKNDRFLFMINGHYTDQLWLSQGVKQGNKKFSPNFSKPKLVSGCNLSPLLFSLFINNLGLELNSSGLGIDLCSQNVSSIFFADDIVLIGSSRAALDQLMLKTRTFFHSHH